MDRDEEGLRCLLDTHGGKVKGYLAKTYGNVLSSIELNEALYQAAVNVWRNIDSYDENKGKLGSWFLRIAQNCAVDIIRRESKFSKNEVREFNGSLDGIETIEPTTDDKSVRKLKKAFRNAVKDLPPVQRSIIEADLAAEDGRASAARLAEMHGTTAGSIRVSRNKAKANLKRALEDEVSSFTGRKK
ncbi:MAG: sigma-70 family RNA polymerase sigma factor, partial [Bdellovibrionales bacterium]|nr:sigma-70 family RNA polymerase sigma factor [Bdellovibrionales bacterium]